MPLDVARRGTLDKRDPPLKAIVAANDDYEAGFHKGNVGGLDAIDVNLATANIKNGITIFGFAGSADVHDISDATAIEAEVITGETFYAASGGIRTGTMPIEALDPALNEYPAGYHVGAASLTAIDAQLVTGSIKFGVTIFGVAGHTDVRDSSDATATATRVRSGYTFYAGGGARKTGTLATVAITAANDNYPAGYHAGNAGGLDAIDTDLTGANIKYGKTIFGKVGSTNVRDTTDANALVGDVKSPKTFYAGGGAKKTGTMATRTLSPDNDTVLAGYYAATTLHAVDAHLAAGNIKEGITIFGFLGTLVEGVDVSDANAAVGDVKQGQTFYSVAAPRKTGTLPTKTLSALNDTVQAGYYAATLLSTIDVHLAPANIKKGVNIFGKVGTFEGEALTVFNPIDFENTSIGTLGTWITMGTAEIPDTAKKVIGVSFMSGVASGYELKVRGMYNAVQKYFAEGTFGAGRNLMEEASFDGLGSAADLDLDCHCNTTLGRCAGSAYYIT